MMRNPTRATALLPLIALLAVALVSCTSDTSGPVPSGQDPAAGARSAATQVKDRGGSDEVNTEFYEDFAEFWKKKEYDTGDTLVVGTIGDADSLNPLVATTANASDVYELLFLRLTLTNPDFSHGPQLATHWEFSDDRRELTFHLRDDVYWHDGVKVTAEDVQFSFEMQRHPDVAWSAIKWKRYIDRCEVIDENTVKFIYKEVYPYQVMDAVVGEIVPKHILEAVPPIEWKSADFNQNPVGNGPYKFKEWKPQQYIEIVANERYHEGRPPLDRIIFKVVPDQESLRLQLKSGEIDFMQGVPPNHYRDLAREPHLVPHVYPSRNYTYIGWNLRDPLFGSKNVRRALTMAINRREIIEALLFGFGEVATGPILPILADHNPNLQSLPFDPEGAKRLLAREGWTDSNGDGWLDKDGERFSFTLKTNKGNSVREDITVMVQDMLKQVGIQVRPNILEWTIFSRDLRNKDFQAAVAGWSVSLKMDMTTIWHSSSINDKFNFVSYANPELDKIIDAAALEMDRAKARKLWWRAQEIIVEDQPYTFLYAPKQINFIHERFKNVKMQTIGWTYNVHQWWVPEEKQKYK